MDRSWHASSSSTHLQLLHRGDAVLAVGRGVDLFLLLLLTGGSWLGLRRATARRAQSCNSVAQRRQQGSSGRRSRGCSPVRGQHGHRRQHGRRQVAAKRCCGATQRETRTFLAASFCAASAFFTMLFSSFFSAASLTPSSADRALRNASPSAASFLRSAICSVQEQREGGPRDSGSAGLAWLCRGSSGCPAAHVSGLLLGRCRNKDQRRRPAALRLAARRAGA